MGVRLKLGVPGQRGGRILDVDEQGVGGLKNWVIFITSSFKENGISFFLFGSFAGKKRTENAIYRYSHLLMKSKSTKLHFIKENLFAEKRNVLNFFLSWSMVTFSYLLRQGASFRVVYYTS